MFNFKEFVKNGLIKAVGKMADYQIILNAAGWHEKGVLLEEDLAEIQSAIEQQYIIEEEPIDEVIEFEVSGDKIEAIYMIPGWTHNIINLSDTEDLVTVMTCNEIFIPEKPDTFGEPV